MSGRKTDELALSEVSRLRGSMPGVSDTVIRRVGDSLHKTAEFGNSAEQQAVAIL